MKRWPLLLSFVLFLGLCMSATYWVMQFIKPAVRPVSPAKAPEHSEVSLESLMGLFGGHLSLAAASNYQLRGVVVSKNEKESVAIVVADGKPAVAVRVDGEVMSGVVVKEVHSQYVLLSENGAIKRVELPVNAPSHGDAPILPQLPQVPQMPQPVVQQQIPQPPPPQPEGEPAQQSQQPPPQPDPAQGRIGRSAARMRNNVNN